jgi:hypothetical protein
VVAEVDHHLGRNGCLGTKTPPSIKDERLYEDLRKQGDSKEMAARISNAAAAQGRSAVGKRGGRSGSYEDWTGARLASSSQRAWGAWLFGQAQAGADQPHS